VDRCTQETFTLADSEWFAAVEAALNQTAASSTAPAGEQQQQPRRWVQLRSEETFQRCELASIVQVSECAAARVRSLRVTLDLTPTPNRWPLAGHHDGAGCGGCQRVRDGLHGVPA